MLSPKLPLDGKKRACIVSGGNLELARRINACPYHITALRRKQDILVNTGLTPRARSAPPAPRTTLAPFAADKRYAQADKETLVTLGLCAFYFLWWWGWAYGLGDTDPEEYSYILGFPAWFFMSCIAGYPVITLVLWGALRLWFKDMPLNEDAEDAENIGTSASIGIAAASATVATAANDASITADSAATHTTFPEQRK